MCKQLPLLFGLVCSFMLPAGARAAEYGASGFMLQGLLGGGTTLVGVAGADTSLRNNSFDAMPGLRIGAMLRPLAVAANISYFSSATLRSSGYAGGNVIALGPDLLPFVWRSAGDHARLYLLFGFNVGALIDSNPGNQTAYVTGGLTFGIGGLYNLHPNFALGVELGSRTQFSNLSGGLLVTSTLYAALSGTFVAGRP